MHADSTLPGSSSVAGVDFAFLHRVYRTSLILMVVAGLLIGEQLGWPVALGWLLGAALSVAVLVSVEWSVRRFFRPEGPSPRALMGVTLLKLVVALVVLAVAFADARRGWINLWGVFAGFGLAPAVLGLKLLGRRVLKASRSGPGRTRR